MFYLGLVKYQPVLYKFYNYSIDNQSHDAVIHFFFRYINQKSSFKEKRRKIEYGKTITIKILHAGFFLVMRRFIYRETN